MKTKTIGFNVGYALGSSSLLAALVYFFASNWGYLERWQKLAPMTALIVVLYGLHVWLSFRPNRLFLSRLSLLSCCLAFGIGLALVGQTYNSHADSYSLFAVWFLAAAALSVVVRWQPFYVLAYALAHATYFLYFFPTVGGSDYSEGTVVGIMAVMAAANGLIFGIIQAKRLHSPAIGFLSYSMLMGSAVAMSNSFQFEAYFGWFDAAAVILGAYFTMRFIRSANQPYLLWNGLLAAAFLVMKYVELLVYFDGLETFFVTGLFFVALFIWGGAKWIQYIKSLSPADDSPEAGMETEQGQGQGQESKPRNGAARSMIVRALSIVIIVVGTIVGSITLLGFVLLVTEFEDPEYALTVFGLLASLGMLAARKLNPIFRYTVMAIGLCIGAGTAVAAEFHWLLLAYAAIAAAAFLFGAGLAERLMWFAVTTAIVGVWLEFTLDGETTNVLTILTAAMPVVWLLHRLTADTGLRTALRLSGYYGFLTLFFILTFQAGRYAYDGAYFFIVLACIAIAHRRGDLWAFRIALAFWSLFLMWKYYDTAWKLLHKSWSLALIGCLIMIGAYALERKYLKTVEPVPAEARSRSRMLWIAATVLAALLIVTLQIGRSETIIARGETIYLELQPRDPRSMLQGDYVELRYTAASLPEVLKERLEKQLADGAKVTVVLTRTPSGLSVFKQLREDGYVLLPGESIMNGKWRWNRIEYGIETFFVPEGTGIETERAAKYAEVKVGANGNALLIRLLPELPAAS
ncbi:GDYXXLXY domain-containing protein [Paenibacillus hodogayensis]|uniref:GDYXXLXY domain-containing protein n=1 Tax=Paenibacillus hodogayensis TaxID=279208 RepID=A0ABV5VV87_9BACL